ncbi:MAG: nucleotidyltransferase family protein [Nitrososphaerales archaeon]|jgi:molybdenum cofactor cytidylyltransferase
MKKKTAANFVSIIVLAAGFSKRFGRNKLLEPVGSTPIIEHVVSECLRSSVDQVIVVVGHDRGMVEEALEGHRCEIVFNEDFAKGQSFSVRKGLSMVDETADAVMVLPGDVALIDRVIIDAVVDEYASSYAPIVTAAYRGRPGHPILFDRNLLGELRGIDEETRGLKKVVSNHKQHIRLVETSERALLDVDDEDDLRRLSEIVSTPAR